MSHRHRTTTGQISLTRSRRCRRDAFPVARVGDRIDHKRLGPVVVVSAGVPEYWDATMAEDSGNPQYAGCWVQDYVVAPVPVEVAHVMPE